MLRPGTQAPSLTVQTLNNDSWNLAEQKPDEYTMVVFYRGDHCPICRKYLTSLSERLRDFKKYGVSNVIAISGDNRSLAEKTRTACNINDLTIGFEHDLNSMAEWGLYISKSIRESEPEYFGEPGLFLIDSKGKIFSCSTSSLPFARPRFEDLLDGLEIISAKNYPRRGTVSYDMIRDKNEIEAKDQVDWSSEIEMADNHIVTDPREEKPVPELK